MQTVYFFQIPADQEVPPGGKNTVEGRQDEVRYQPKPGRRFPGQRQEQNRRIAPQSDQETRRSGDIARLEEVRVHWLGKKGVLTDQEAEEVRADMMRDFATQTSAGKININSSVTEMKLYGDLRLRYQYDDREAQVAETLREVARVERSVRRDHAAADRCACPPLPARRAAHLHGQR